MPWWIMHSDKTIAVVVPAYNEETLIEQTLISIPDFVDKVIVVNDAGNDHTGQVVKKIAQKDTRIILIQHEVNVIAQ